MQFMLQVVVACGQANVLRLVGRLTQRVGHRDRFVLQGDQVVQRAAGFVPDRSPGRELGLLFEIAHLDGGVKLAPSGVRLIFASDDSQQRGLARPVRPDQPDPLARMHLELHPRQYGVGAKSLFEMLDGDDNHPSSRRPGPASRRPSLNPL
jgi:hypothetical protein